MEITAFGTTITLPKQCPYCSKGKLKTGFVNGVKIPVRCDLCNPNLQPLNETRIHGDIEYFDGEVKKISSAHLKDIRSRVVTHEGEVLSGKRGRHYLDNYSKKYLGKDMSGFYKSTQIT
jgi:hypothetical protein